MVATVAKSKASKLDNSQRERPPPDNPVQHVLNQFNDRIHNQQWFTARGLAQLSASTGQQVDLLAKGILAAFAVVVTLAASGHFVANAVLVAVPILLVFVYPKEAPPSGQLYVYWGCFGALSVFDRVLEKIMGYYVVKSALLYLLFLDPYRYAQVIYLEVHKLLGNNITEVTTDKRNDSKGSSRRSGFVSQWTSLAKSLMSGTSARSGSQKSGSSVVPDRAAGLVIVRQSNGTNEYLLLNSSTTNQWMPPNGHLAVREDEWTAANRNVNDVCGIETEKLHITKECNEVAKSMDQPRSTRYWLAISTRGEEPVLTSQHSKSLWCSFEEAHMKVAASVKPVLAKFNEYLASKSPMSTRHSSSSNVRSTRTANLASPGALAQSRLKKSASSRGPLVTDPEKSEGSAPVTPLPTSTRTALLIEQKAPSKRAAPGLAQKTPSTRTALGIEPTTPSTRTALGAAPKKSASTRTAIAAETKTPSTRTAVGIEPKTPSTRTAPAPSAKKTPSAPSKRTALNAEPTTNKTPSQRASLFGSLFGAKTTTATTETETARKEASNDDSVRTAPLATEIIPVAPVAESGTEQKTSTQTAEVVTNEEGGGMKRTIVTTTKTTTTTTETETTEAGEKADGSSMLPASGMKPSASALGPPAASDDASSKRVKKKTSSVRTAVSGDESSSRRKRYRYQKAFSFPKNNEDVRTAIPAPPSLTSGVSSTRTAVSGDDASSRRAVKKKESSVRTAVKKESASTRTAIGVAPTTAEELSGFAKKASENRTVKTVASTRITIPSEDASSKRAVKKGSSVRTAIAAPPSTRTAVSGDDESSRRKKSGSSLRTAVRAQPAKPDDSKDESTEEAESNAQTAQNKTRAPTATDTNEARTPLYTPKPTAMSPNRMKKLRRQESATDIGGGSLRNHAGANEMETNQQQYAITPNTMDTSGSGTETGPAGNLHDLVFLPMNCIVFNAPFDFEHLTYHMRIQNKSHHRMTFAIKGNCIPRVTAYPPSGILEPQQKMVIAVTIRKFEWNEYEFNKDRLAFEYVLLKASQKDVKQFSHKLLTETGFRRRKNIAIHYNP